jgi:hypothetical protein
VKWKQEMRNKPHSYVHIGWEVSRNAVLVAGSNTIGCPQNIVTTVVAVSHNIWPAQILAVLEVSAVVVFYKIFYNYNSVSQ